MTDRKMARDKKTGIKGKRKEGAFDGGADRG